MVAHLKIAIQETLTTLTSYMMISVFDARCIIVLFSECICVCQAQISEQADALQIISTFPNQPFISSSNLMHQIQPRILKSPNYSTNIESFNFIVRERCIEKKVKKKVLVLPLHIHTLSKNKHFYFFPQAYMENFEKCAKRKRKKRFHFITLI